MAQLSNEQAYGDPLLLLKNDVTPSEHIVTLPFQASRRPYYDEVLLLFKDKITDFGKIFHNEVYHQPDPALVAKMDELFGRLLNICDYPPGVIGTKLEDLSDVQVAKYACDANAKFNFIFEFLQAVDRDVEVLITARTLELLRLLHAMMNALGVESVAEDIVDSGNNFKDSAARVTLALSTSEAHDPYAYDVVIGFDHSFNPSPVAQRLASKTDGSKAPLVMLLVTTHSIEHIGIHLPNGLSLLEQKNMLLGGIVRARQLLEDPERGYGDPHEAAELFSNYVNGFTDTMSWEPQPLPDTVLDIFEGTQPGTQAALDPTPLDSRLKRKLDDDDDDDDDDDVKRMRLFPLEGLPTEANDPPLSDAVRELLNNAEPEDDLAKERHSKINVSIAVLETLAEKHIEFERRLAANDVSSEQKQSIDRLDLELKSYTREVRKVAESQRAALQDRSIFEKEKIKAETAAKAAAEVAQKESEKDKKRIAALEAQLAYLAARDEATAGGENPIATSERLVQEAEGKITVLKKRLENAHKNEEYMRNLYQDLNSKAGGLDAEIKELRAQNEHLNKTASDNLVRVHEIQSNNATKEHLRSIAELKTQVRERELELDRLREEVRLLRNGRPQTRQASVPRSPRMSMMSPRPPRAAVSGPGSRGTSPAPAGGAGYEASGPGVMPGVQFMGQQPGNGRWGHLRE